MASQYRAYDTVTEWSGPIRGTAEEAAHDAAEHNSGCRQQGGYGSAIVVTPRNGRCYDLHGNPVWPHHGQSCGAVEWVA